MNHSKRFFLSLVLLALLAPALLAAAPPHEGVVVEYLQESVTFDKLTVASGETVQQTVRVPVSFHYTNGTSEAGYETATFTLANETTLLAGTTYVTCFGSLNAGNRQYTGKVEWHFDGTAATLDVGDKPAAFTASWPYQAHSHNSTANGVWGAPLSAYTAGFFTGAGPLSNKDHIISWTLPHTNSHCSASGLIANAP